MKAAASAMPDWLPTRKKLPYSLILILVRKFPSSSLNPPGLGTDPTHILERLVAEYLPPVGSNSGSTNHKYDTPQERVAAMDAIAEKYANASILQKSAFDRESSYEDTL